MKNTIKGALAVGTAGVILLGGAGSLAYWNTSQNVGTAAISSGSITLSSPNCTTGTGVHGWQLDNGDTYTPATDQMVPGDSISKVCDLTLAMSGTHIGATLAIDTAGLTASTSGAPDAALASALTATATFTVNGAAYTAITVPGTYTVRATTTVTFGAGADDTTENGKVNLSAINVLATQTHDTAANS